MRFQKEPVIVRRNTWFPASQGTDGSFVIGLVNPNIVLSSLDRYGRISVEMGATSLQLSVEEGQLAKAQIAHPVGEPELVELQVYGNCMADPDAQPVLGFHETTLQQRFTLLGGVELLFS